MFKRTIPLILALALSATAAIASESIESAQQHLDAFMESPDYHFAPATTSRAQAYLGAAMLAEKKNDQDGMADGVTQTLATLNEAKGTASRFREQFPELIRVKESTDRTFHVVGSFDPLQEPNPRFLLQNARQSLADTVDLFEKGDLNNSRQAADVAIIDYRKTLDAALPGLIDVAGDTFSKAITAGAKSYAPQSYAAAKAELQVVQQYVDGLSVTAPEHPERALHYSERALAIAKQVKIWRKDNGSHEGMILKTRSDRLAIAEVLGIPFDANNPDIDISSDTILNAVTLMKHELDRERAGRAKDREMLEAEFKEKLQANIESQKSELMAEQSEKVSNLKEAFRAKLEKETFEVNRQKQVRQLFKEGEVEILANVDSSLLIRLTALQFKPGSSKIGSSSYDLLGRVKQALNIYGDRNVRIEGHTDSRGDVKLNQSISLKRAEAVRDFLIAASMDGGRLKALGYGEVRPIASNDFEKGRAMNRRIDVVVETAEK